MCIYTVAALLFFVERTTLRSYTQVNKKKFIFFFLSKNLRTYYLCNILILFEAETKLFEQKSNFFFLVFNKIYYVYIIITIMSRTTIFGFILKHLWLL